MPGGVSGAGGGNAAALQQIQNKFTEASSTVKNAQNHVETCKATLGSGPERPVRTQPAAQKTVFDRIGAAISEAMNSVSSFFKGLTNRTAVVQTPVIPQELAKASPNELSPKEYAQAKKALASLENRLENVVKALEVPNTEGYHCMVGSADLREATLNHLQSEWSAESVKVLLAPLRSPEGLSIDKSTVAPAQQQPDGFFARPPSTVISTSFNDINLPSRLMNDLRTSMADLESLGLAKFNISISDSSKVSALKPDETGRLRYDHNIMQTLKDGITAVALNDEGGPHSKPLTPEQGVALKKLGAVMGECMGEIVRLLNEDSGSRLNKPDNIAKSTEGLRGQIDQLKQKIGLAESESLEAVAKSDNAIAQELGSISNAIDLAMALKADYSLADGIAGNMAATNPARQEYESFVADNTKLTSREDIVEGFFDKVQSDILAESIRLSGLE